MENVLNVGHIKHVDEGPLLAWVLIPFRFRIGILSLTYRFISRLVDVSPILPSGLQEGRPLKEIEELGMKKVLMVMFITLDGVAEFLERASPKLAKSRA
ncbi:MAG: hypothetical protein WCB19_02470 [Thermoplasmata archaeon]